MKSIDPYGIKEWVNDGIAAGFLFHCVRWKPPVYIVPGSVPATVPLTFSVLIIYRPFPNQRQPQEIKFEDVKREELHASRMRIVEADRKWKEGNLALGRCIATD